MATISLPNFDSILTRVQHDYPHVTFKAGHSFYWSPVNKQIMYRQNAAGLKAIFSLLHELGHATLEHKHYKHDFELLQLEVVAWDQAKMLASRYGVIIDEDHLQDCLDSYRDWLYGRSICPTCTTKALQDDDLPQYRCFNCHTIWRVAPSRFCRPYRQQQAGGAAAVFASRSRSA